MPEFESVTLKDPSSSVTATFVPVAGMVATSLADGGDEFLGQRRGLDAYVKSGKTMGIPILYPWANRLSASNYDIDGAVVTLTPGAGGVRTDEHGAPMHGVLAAYPGWMVTSRLFGRVSSLTGLQEYRQRSTSCWPTTTATLLLPFTARTFSSNADVCFSSFSTME